MKALVLSNAAVADLEAIERYGSERFGEDVAEAYVRGFEAAFVLIAEHPRIGAIHDAVRPPIRSVPHGRHRIFYDVADDQIIVQRVLHKAMDVERWL